MVYVLGDSISMHYGPYLETYLHGVMRYTRKQGNEKAPLNLEQGKGANGGDSSQVLAFLRAKAQSGGFDADLLLLNCGLHDIRTDASTGKKQVPIEQYEKNLKAIIRVVKGMKLDLVWIRTTPCDEKVHNRPGMTTLRFAADGEAYNKAADEIMAAAKIPIIDLCTFTHNLGPDLYCDHVHFYPPIREKQAAFIAGWLCNWLQGNGGRPAR